MSLKAHLLELIRTTLENQLERLSQAARETRADATDPDSKAESKYDTRSLEASYLAIGQAKQAEDLAEAVRIFRNLSLPDFDIDSAVDAGALVEVEIADESRCFLLVPAAGGTTIEDEGREITLLTPDSPLYRELLGRRIGDVFGEDEAMITEVA